MIRLMKDKIIYSTSGYNPKCDKYVKKEVPHLWPYLGEVVELCEDFTLEDFFNYMERDKYSFNVIFDSCLGHYPLQFYIDDIKKSTAKKDSEIDYLEIRRYGERWSWGDIDLFINFSGVSVKEDFGYAIEFTPLNELKHLPLRLNEEFSISEMKCPSRITRYLIRLLKKIYVPLKKWDGPFTYTYVKGKTEFTVYELISAVLSEISFAGSPEERDRRMIEIEEEIDEIVDSIPIDEEISDVG